MTQLTHGAAFVCSACGAHSPNWDLCVGKGLGAWRGHDWTKLPECDACDDTGYEPGEGLYCTFCKAGCAVATRQLKIGINPWGEDPALPEGDPDGG